MQVNMKQVIYTFLLLTLAQMSVHAQGTSPGQKESLFFVKGENLYYAAIESKDIPPFHILSNHQVINYASCMKVILQKAGMEVPYAQLINKYLSSSIDSLSVPEKNRSRKIHGHRVITTYMPCTSSDASQVVSELLQKRMMIAIDKSGHVGLLTAIAMTAEPDPQPVHVRLRMPMLPNEEQRVQMSWRDFCNQFNQLVKVCLY